MLKSLSPNFGHFFESFNSFFFTNIYCKDCYLLFIEHGFQAKIVMETNFARQSFKHNYPNRGRAAVAVRVVVDEAEEITVEPNNLQNEQHHGYIPICIDCENEDDEIIVDREEEEVIIVAADIIEETPKATVEEDWCDITDEADRELEDDFNNMTMDDILGLNEFETAFLPGSRCSVELRVREIVYPRVTIMVIVFTLFES